MVCSPSAEGPLEGTMALSFRGDVFVDDVTLWANDCERGDPAAYDQDADGIGEYGLLGELAGELIPRQCTKRIGKPYLSKIFYTGGKNGKGYVESGGYRIVLYLPTDGSGKAGDDKTLGGTMSSPGKICEDAAGIDMQELHFACYAWPKVAGSTGRRAFFVNETGKLYATDMRKARYSGDNMPPASAAYSGLTFQDQPSKSKYKGNDGNIWRLVPEQ